MIPTIGVMIGVYILFRCFEVFLFAPNRYGGSVRHGLAMAAAIVLGLLVLVCLASVLIQP